MTYKTKQKASAVLYSAAMVVSIALAGCGHVTEPNYTLTPSPVTPAAEVTAEPEASVSPETTASPQATTSPEETETAEEAAAPEESAAPAEPESTSEAVAVPETTEDEYVSTTVADVAAPVTDNSGDDCGWVEDWSMADGGYCSLHPEWYGMAAAPAEQHSSPAQSYTSQPSSGITFYSQFDGRWSGQWIGDAKFGPHGCGPTAMAMMLSGRGIYMTPADVGWMLNSWGLFGNASNGFLGMYADAWFNLANNYGWSSWSLYSADDLYNALASGADVGLALNYGNVGHTVYVRGVDAYGNTTVYDGNASGPYTKSIYTLWNQVYDPGYYYGVAVAIGR